MGRYESLQHTKWECKYIWFGFRNAGRDFYMGKFEGTGVFPLFEVEQGRYRLSIDFQQLRPVRDYTKLQGRFRHLTDDMIKEIETHIHEEYDQLREKAGKEPLKPKCFLETI